MKNCMKGAVILMLILAGSSVFATKPERIVLVNVSYTRCRGNTEMEKRDPACWHTHMATVQVKVIHGTGNPRHDYISRISLAYGDGRGHEVKRFTRQENPEYQSAVFSMLMHGPDVAFVEANCSGGLFLSERFTLAPPEDR